mmetsp:Transcript_106654/g.159541  ORF Transcript_106654/g.159541 Transcript_106654/m.159541 type:complete len:154 (-) Transcript_106654:145-606(-)
MMCPTDTAVLPEGSTTQDITMSGTSPNTTICAFFSALTHDDLLPTKNGPPTEVHPFHTSQFLKPDHSTINNAPSNNHHHRSPRHKHKHRGQTKHRRYRTMDVVPTYMKPVQVKRPEPIVEETQESFGWGDFPVSKRMLPIPVFRKHRRHHTFM